MKKTFTFLIALLITSSTVFGFIGSGSGTPGDPYLVTSAAELNDVRNNLTAYYKQMNDIDLSSATWTTISGSFSGTYDGNGYKVSNFTITATAAQSGFFASVTGTVKNLGLVNVTFNAGTYFTAGILAGVNSGTIQNCYTTGSLSGSGATYGGLVGNNNGGTISGCYSSASVTSTSSSSNAYVGGLVGQSPGNSSITNSYATGAVSNTSGIAGGLIGQTTIAATTISYCYSIGAVSGATQGGFVGKYSAGTFNACYFDETTSGLTSVAGSGSPSGITGASTSNMQTASTFISASWSGSIWSLVDGSYPKLLWQLPAVISIAPTFGPTTGGTSVIITGTNLTGATAVKFGSTNATGYTVNSATQITATSSAGSAGTVDITVTTSGGTSATGSADQFTYVAAPTVTGISSASGPTTGGTSVIITGTNLTGATAVKFGLTNATGYTVNSATQITATSPAGSAGTVDITVTTSGGTSATSSADQFTYLAPGTWIGLIDSYWTKAGNWSDNQVPTATTDVTIPGLPIGGYLPVIFPNEAADCHNLTTESNALEILSSSSGIGSLIVHGTATGSVQTDIYQAKDEWHIVAPASNGGNLHNFLYNNGALIAQKDVSGTTYYGMTDYDEKENKWNDYFSASTSGVITSGKGYLLRLSDNSLVVAVYGQLTTGTKTVNLTKLGEGWNCVGNPYTSAIGMNSLAESEENFLTRNSGSLESSYACVYVWDPTSSTYKILGNLPSGLNPDRGLVQNYFQLGQGFFVKAKDAASSIQFTPQMRIHNAAAVLKSAEVPWMSVALKAATEATSSTALVYFHEGMTKGLDVTYDAGLLRGSNGLSLYTKLIDDNGVEFAIQCLPENGMESFIVPVGLETQAGGEVKFSATATGLPTGISVILEDRIAKVYTDLSKGGEYVVTLSANSSGIGRFYIRTSNLTTGTSDLLPDGSFRLKAYPADGVIWIDGHVSSKAVARLYDAMGSQIGRYKLEEGERNSIPASGITSGVYILKVVDGNEAFTTKLVLISNQ